MLSFQMPQLKNKIYFAFLLIIIFGGTIGFLAFKHIAPFGKIVYYRFTSKLPGAQEVSVFSPGKNSVLKIPSQVITTSKSKLQLELLSSNVDSIRATLKFKPTVNEVLFGVRGNEKDNFYYRPLYRDLIYQLKWPKIEENGLSLWQKGAKYNSIGNFINNPPLDKPAAFYYIDPNQLPKPKLVTTKESAKTIIDTPLRGSQNILFQVNTSPLIFKISKRDLNYYDREDKLKITVSSGENKLFEKTIEDDGITDSSKLKTQPQEETITLKDISAGLYRLDLAYEGKGDDILIPKIEVNQAKVIFEKHVLFLGEKPTTLWTNAKRVSVITAHKESLQTIKLDDKYNLEIKEDGKVYEFDLESLAGKKTGAGLYKLESPKNDLIISGDGYFSFSQDAFFLPEMVKGVELDTLENLDNVDYLLTSYPYPKKEGDWLIAEAEFNPKNLKIDGNKLYFSLEIPQIAKYGAELEIDYLEIEVKSGGGLEEAFKKKSEDKSVSTEASKDGKKNIFQKTGQKVSQFFGNIYNKTKTFLVSSFNKLFKKKKAGQELPKPTLSPTPKPSLSPLPSPTPSPSPKVEKFEISVKVLNGGGESGAAKQFADKLKENGFANAVFGNADNSDYQEATINYQKANEPARGKIFQLLLDFGYKNINGNETATSSSEIIVILGKK